MAICRIASCHKQEEYFNHRMKRVRVSSHVGTKCKAENERPITEHLEEERNLKLFCKACDY